MELFIHLCGFAGGWLLVAGPVYQAAIELREETFGRTSFRGLAAEVPKPQPVSSWWWLLPPVHYALSRQRSNAYRTAAFAALSVEQRGQMVGFVNKATGWMLVAGGAALIAVKETWEVVELLHWPPAVFWIAVVAMSLLALGNTVVRIRTADQMIADPMAQRRRRRPDDR